MCLRSGAARANYNSLQYVGTLLVHVEPFAGAPAAAKGKLFGVPLKSSLLHIVWHHQVLVGGCLLLPSKYWYRRVPVVRAVGCGLLDMGCGCRLRAMGTLKPKLRFPDFGGFSITALLFYGLNTCERA